MKKLILIGGLLGILVGGFVGYSLYNKPHRNIATEDADFKLSANDLFDEFDADEKAANEKYLDKVIEVTGDLIEISVNQDGKSVLTLEAENAMIGGVMCTMKEETKIENGNYSLKCRCTGFLDDVILVDCSIEKVNS